MAIETYKQALDFWADRTNYEKTGLPTNSGEFTLERMRALLDRLGQPQDKFKIIHVAGTKGKGSTSAMLAAILQQAGYRTGLFTSPHLINVDERVQVDGEAIAAIDFTECIRKIEHAAQAVEFQFNSTLTFFEIITALGFLHFARMDVDVAVIEVGLGGRLDSTNVCTPLVSVITSISFDHMAILGSTLSSIASEKAGIIKQGRPIVSGATNSEAATEINRTALERESPLMTLGTDFSYHYREGRVTSDKFVRSTVTVRIHDDVWPELELPLLGEHQAANAAVVLACVSLLRREGFLLPVDAVRSGLRNVKWPARLEVVGTSPTVVLDCAHNVASIEAAVATVRASFATSRRGLIFACSQDKDIPGMLAKLVQHFDRVWFTQYSTSTRGAQADELAELWQRQRGGSCEVVCTPAVALDAAREWAGTDDLICVLGSVFLAGEIRTAIDAKLISSSAG